MNQEKIGKYIAEKRKNKKLTQSELGEKLGVSYKAVSKWERGINLPDISIMKDLCKILNISINELLNGEDEISDEGVTNYLDYQKKKYKLKTIIISTTLLLAIILLIFIIYFVNNYNKVQGYILTGESDNFVYSDNLFIESNIKNINAFGNILSKNPDIKTSDIIKMSLKCDDYLIVSTKILGGVVYETYGYEDLFPKKVRDNLDKWIVEVVYVKNNKEYTEIINLNNTNILKNDGLFYKKIEKASLDAQVNNTWRENRDKYFTKVKDELLKRGFTWVPITAYTTSSHTTMAPSTLKKEYKDGSYFLYRTKKGMWQFYGKDYNFKGKIYSRLICINVKKSKDDILKQYYYSMKTDKFVNCDSKVCDEYLPLVREMAKVYKNEFSELYYFTENEWLDDKKVE